MGVAVGQLVAVGIVEEPANADHGDGAGQLLLVQEFVADGGQAELPVQRVGLLESFDHGLAGVEYAGVPVVEDHARRRPQLGGGAGVESRQRLGVPGEVLGDLRVDGVHGNDSRSKGRHGPVLVSPAPGAHQS
ncbi:hypothetical protein GCM10028799_66750 [Kribbella italica]